MKKIGLLLTAALLCVNTYAQLTNPDFEIVDSGGRAINWNPALMIGIQIDTNCIGHGMDSMNFATQDAYLGSRAMELRNGEYCGTVYAGNVRPTRNNSDSFYNQSVPFRDRPAFCSFYYKLYPVQGDEARIQIQLDAEDGTPVADGYQVLSGINGDWAKVTIPLTYYDDGSPGFLNMRFEIANDTQLHYGSRFLFDHIRFDTPTAIASINGGEDAVTCYPVPARDMLYIRAGKAFKPGNVIIHIADATGRTVKTCSATLDKNHTAGIATAGLSAGVYFLRITAGGFTAQGKFIK